MKQLCVLQGFLPINQKKLLTSEFVTLQINVHLLLIAWDLSNFSTMGKRLHYLFKMKLELTNP